MRSSLPRLVRRLARDARGGVLIEFALLAPVFLTLLVGVLQVGMHVQNSNAVRNLAADGARLAMVQYQRENRLSTDLVAASIESMGVGPKYNLNADRLGVVVGAPASRIAGIDEMSISITYEAPNFLAFVDTAGLDLEYERAVFLLPAS